MRSIFFCVIFTGCGGTPAAEIIHLTHDAAVSIDVVQRQPCDRKLNPCGSGGLFPDPRSDPPLNDDEWIGEELPPLPADLWNPKPEPAP